MRRLWMFAALGLLVLGIVLGVQLWRSAPSGWEFMSLFLLPLYLGSAAVLVLVLLGAYAVARQGAIAAGGGNPILTRVLLGLVALGALTAAVWPFTVGQKIAEALCRDEGGVRGTPTTVEGFATSLPLAGQTIARAMARRLVLEGYRFVEEPATAPRLRAGTGALGQELSSLGATGGLRYQLMPTGSAGCARWPGVTDGSAAAALDEVALPAGMCIGVDPVPTLTSSVELRQQIRDQWWPTYIRWREILVVERATGKTLASFRSFARPGQRNIVLDDTRDIPWWEYPLMWLAPRAPCGRTESLAAQADSIFLRPQTPGTAVRIDRLASPPQNALPMKVVLLSSTDRASNTPLTDVQPDVWNEGHPTHFVVGDGTIPRRIGRRVVLRLPNDSVPSLLEDAGTSWKLLSLGPSVLGGRDWRQVLRLTSWEGLLVLDALVTRPDHSREWTRAWYDPGTLELRHLVRGAVPVEAQEGLHARVLSFVAEADGQVVLHLLVGGTPGRVVVLQATYPAAPR